MKILLVARRIGLQLLRDPRFLVLALGVPVALVTLLKYVLAAVAPPAAGATLPRYALPAAGFVVHFIAYVLCALALVRERQSGTLARMFACGFRRHEIVVGYVLGFAALAAAQTATVIAATVHLFDVEVGANAPAVFGTTLSLALVSIALGMFVSNFARTEGQIFPFVPLVIVPSLLLSGLVIDRAVLPDWLWALGLGVPLTYAESVLLGLMRDGKAFADVALPFIELVGYGLLLLGLASLTLKERE